MIDAVAPAVLILAGGAGTRLWPVSTDENPKQFLKIFGGESLIQKTWTRLRNVADAGRIYVSTNERYAATVARQLPELLPGNILLEPARRNTAPAIAWCCARIDEQLPGATISIFPSDHAVQNEDAFVKVIRRALNFAGESDSMVTIAFEPTEPATGFGYLELGESLGEGVARVRRFVEKPDLRRAREFLAAGHYGWNGGMFFWRHEVFTRELQASAPEISRIVQSMLALDEEGRRALYESMPSISIDYAIMERAAHVAAVSAGNVGWSDVGSWKAVAKVAPRAADGTLVLEDAAGVYALSTSGKRIGVIGLQNIAVIESADGVLVVDLEKSELLSSLVKKLS